MNDTTVNFTPEASTNSINDAFGGMNDLDICTYSISILFGLLTDFYVLRLIITGTGSGVTSEFFNLNLIFCEICICLNSLLSVFYNYTGISHLIRLACFLLGPFITSHPLFQCLMCVERYLAVVHPVTFPKYKPLRYRVICSTAIATLGSCLFCMFITDQFNLQMYIYFYLIHFLLFLFIQLFCLVAFLIALKQSGPGERGRERKEEHHMKRRAFYLILITIVTVTFIYLSFIISGFIFILMQWVMHLFSFGFFCFILAGFVQPVLYLHKAGKCSCLCSS